MTSEELEAEFARELLQVAQGIRSFDWHTNYPEADSGERWRSVLMAAALGVSMKHDLPRDEVYLQMLEAIGRLAKEAAQGGGTVIAGEVSLATALHVSWWAVHIATAMDGGYRQFSYRDLLN